MGEGRSSRGAGARGVGGAAIRGLVVALALAACGAERADATPEGALVAFLDAVERSTDTRGAVDAAYALVDRESQAHLVERARSATSLGSREFTPAEMLVEGRSIVRLRPRRGSGLRARVRGDTAVVAVTSEDGATHADVRMVREEGGWRVVLDVPPLVPVAPAAP